MKQESFCTCTRYITSDVVQFVCTMHQLDFVLKESSRYYLSPRGLLLGHRLQSLPKHRSSEASHMQKQSKVTVLCSTRSQYWEASRYNGYFGSQLGHKQVTNWNESSKMRK